MASAPTFMAKSFDKADAIREFPLGKLELLDFDGDEIGRLVIEPGWRWSASLGPIMGTDLCEAAHSMYLVQGIVRITMRGGRQYDLTPGMTAFIPPGHDAEVVGDETAIAVDWQGLSNYAVRR